MSSRRPEYLYDHPSRIPAAGRKSVSGLRGGAQVGEAKKNGANAPNGGGWFDFVKDNKIYFLSGAAILAVFIAYHLYSKRSAQSKDDETTARGVDQIKGAEARPTLQVDPAVLEQLQQQMKQYQDTIRALKEGIVVRDQAIDQLRASGQIMSPESGFTTMAGQMGGAAGLPPGALGQFSGLHGQVPPMGQGLGPMAPGAMGIGMPMQTRDAFPPIGASGQMGPGGQNPMMAGMGPGMTHPLLGNFPTMFPNQNQQQGQGQMGQMGGQMPPMGQMTPQMIANQPIGSAQMGAFSNEPGISSQPPMASGTMFGANAQMFRPF